MPKIGQAEDDDKVVRPFAAFLAEHNNGAAANKASEELHALVAAVRDTGKKGTLTLKISLSAMDDTTLVALVDVVSAPPKHPEKSAVYFATKDGNLSREDPNQLKFDQLKEVAAPALAVHSSDADDRRDERAAEAGLA